MIDNLIYETLEKPVDARAYFLTRELAQRFPNRCVLSVNSAQFSPDRYAAAGNASMRLRSDLFQHVEALWEGVDHGVSMEGVNSWYELDWNGTRLDVVLVTWNQNYCTSPHYWIVADTEAIGCAFQAAVCEWNAKVRGEVLVFDGGSWYKDEKLFRAIQSSTFENLILPARLKLEIQDDFSAFFASRQTYERYGVPWKRGVVLIGPPGNGKTHTVKALINYLKAPCLYVKSLTARHQSDQDCIRTVFERARQTTPCLLVLEDLDSLITDENRSFFLNELDGFASNTGIVVIATTNHPERLDPALINRPSRFDRKYHMELPAPVERRRYIEAWNSALEPELRILEAEIATAVDATDGFSFAYIKELFLSSVMRWIACRETSSMVAVMVEQSTLLREQMEEARGQLEAPAGRDLEQYGFEGAEPEDF